MFQSSESSIENCGVACSTLTSSPTFPPGNDFVGKLYPFAVSVDSDSVMSCYCADVTKEKDYIDER